MEECNLINWIKLIESHCWDWSDVDQQVDNPSFICSDSFIGFLVFFPEIFLGLALSTLAHQYKGSPTRETLCCFLGTPSLQKMLSQDFAWQ